MEFPEGGRGIVCGPFLENPEGWGGHMKNPFRGGGMDIFWNHTFTDYNSTEMDVLFSISVFFLVLEIADNHRILSSHISEMSNLIQNLLRHGVCVQKNL